VFSKEQSTIEAILFAAGREVSSKELMTVLELSEEDIEKLVINMNTQLSELNSGVEILKVDSSYQMCSKKDYYESIYPILDNRTKPTISTAALETLSIIAYNPNITRAEIESIRGVGSDGTIYKLLEYGLIENSGKSDAPGRPQMFRTTKSFLKMFGISSLDELPELPKFKIDENEQIVLDEFSTNETEENVEESKEETEEVTSKEDENFEAPMPAREDLSNNDDKKE